MKSWAEVEASPEFSALPAAEQDAARQQYFVQVVAPKVPEQDLEIARAQFDKATRIRKQDMAPDIAPSTAGAGRGMAARGVPTLGEQIGAGLASLGDAPAPVRAGPRRGGMRSEVQPYVAAEPPPMTLADAGPELPSDAAGMLNMGVDAGVEPVQPGGSVLDRPRDPLAGGFRAASETQRGITDRVPLEAQARAAGTRVGPATADQVQAMDLDAAGVGGINRGARAGFAQMGQIGLGAMRLAGDLTGSDTVSGIAKAGSKAASGSERAAMQGLEGGEKLAAQVTSSIMNSLPALAMGVAGGPALTTLFAQSTMAEYNAGRDAGFDISESLGRAGIMGMGEALGERFGLSEQIKLIKSVVKGLPQGELAKVMGNLIAKEIPGEQLTTVIQFMADKIGPAALRPDATLADYLEAAAETLKVTVGQVAVMGGGPAAIVTGSDAYAAATRATEAPETAIARNINQAADAYATFFRPAPEAVAPTAARADSLKRFDEAAAAWGLSPRAAEAVRSQAGVMPADDVPGFLARATAALNRRGLFRRPVDEAAVSDLDRRLRPAEAVPAPAAPTPESDYTGLDTQQEQPDVTQPDLAAAAGVPAGASDGGSDLGGGGGDAVGSAVDGDGRMGGPAADPAPGSGETAAVGTGRGPDAPLTPAPSKFTPEQALARMERQAAEDNQRRGDAIEFEDREASDILGPKGTAWAAKVGANRRLRELGSGYRLARVSTGWVIKPEAADPIAAAAQEAATSPTNDRPEPTDAQKAAGNYKLGHARVSGFDVSIENPKGSMRRSKADDPNPWQVQMPAHYGYIKGTKGSDGDHVDLFVGDKGDNGRFWIINQNHPGTDKHDEHKVVTGVESPAEAVALYKASFADNFGDKVFNSVSAEVNPDGLRAMLPSLEKPRPVKAAPTPDAAAPVTTQAPAVSAEAPAVAAPAPAPTQPKTLKERREAARQAQQDKEAAAGVVTWQRKPPRDGLPGSLVHRFTTTEGMDGQVLISPPGWRKGVKSFVVSFDRTGGPLDEKGRTKFYPTVDIGKYKTEEAARIAAEKVIAENRRAATETPATETSTSAQPAPASESVVAQQAVASANTIFTEDAAAAARARLKAKLGRLQSGLDPETIMDGITLAGYHIEKGARTFAAYARAMVDDLGDAVKPYLTGWYMAIRNDPRAAAFRADMDKASAVEDLDVDAVLAAERDPEADQRAAVAEVARRRALGDEQRMGTVAEPTHKDPGEPAEPVTAEVVAEVIEKAAKNTDRSRSEMKAEALRLVDEAIAKAPDKGDKKITISVPGDGVFKVVNNVTRLKEFRRQIELSPGFKDKLPTYPIGKAVSGGNYGPDQLAREMLEDGEPVNAVEILEAAGKTMMFGNGNGASIPYTNAEPVEIAGIDDLFVGRGFGTKKGATSWWSVVHKGSGFAIGGSAGSKAEAIAEAKKLLGQPEKREKMRALIESGKSADGRAFMTQDELREQFMTEAEDKQQATFNANDASIGLAADRKKREAERDAFYKSIMGADAVRPGFSPIKQWAVADVAALLKEADKQGKVEEALKFIDDVLPENQYLQDEAAKFRKAYERRNKPTDTGWQTGFQAPGGYRRIRRDVTLPDGTTFRAELDERAGAYTVGMVQRWSTDNGTPRTVMTFSNDMDARKRADDYLDQQAASAKPKPADAEPPALNLMSFERTPKGNGAFELRSGDMLVRVEPTERGFYRASYGASMTSGPRLTEQQAIEWASNLRLQSKAAWDRPALKAMRDPATMTAGEINRELDKLDAESRKITDDMLDAGRGSEFPTETVKKRDPLSLRYVANQSRYQALRTEIEVRMGPDAPGRMPARGFGPRKKDETPAAEPATPAPQAAPATPMKYGEANAEAKRLTAETSTPHQAVNRERVDEDGYTVSEWFAEPTKPAAPSKPDPGRYVQPSNVRVASRDGQVDMANRASRIASLQMLNEAVRKRDPGAAYSDGEIQGATNIDAMQDWLSERGRAPQATEPEAAPGWHTPLPTQGEPSTQQDRQHPTNPKAPVDARKVSARLAAEAFAAITQAQQTNLAVSGMKLYPWVLPAQGNRNGVVRLLPEDQRPGAPWQQVGTEPVNAGGVRNLAINELTARLGRAPIIGDEASAARDTFYESLIGKASTEQMSSSGGRTIYSVKITPLMASRQGIEFGRWPETESFALKRMADVTGRPTDEGWALIDKREQAASRAAAEPVKAKEGAAKPGTVENFGEKLPPARRAMAAKLDETLADADIANRPLSEIWPLSENEAIEDTFAAAVAHAARAEVPAKPRQPYKLRHWVEKVKAVRNLTAHVLSGRLTRERLIEEVKGPRASLKDWASKVMLLEQIPREQWKRIGEVEERPEAFTYAESKPVPRPLLRLTIDGKAHYLTGDGTVSGNLTEIRALLEPAAPEKRMEFEVRGPKGGPYNVNKKGDSQYRSLGKYATVSDARDAIAEYNGLVAAWEAVKASDNITERDLRSDENRPRAGKDWREGKDVTPEQFQEVFGFKGGEFGKWVQQGKGDKERQALLNNAYDALMDLAQIAGIPPRAISLNGTLGIAFGSRGNGWASAHFEPSNLVINLTKTRGAGALAHEWFHAADNYFSRMRGGEVPMSEAKTQTGYRDSNYITHKPEALMVPKSGSRYLPPMTRTRLEAEHARRKDKTDAYNPANWQPDPKHPLGVRPEVEQRFADLVQALNDSPMSKRARELDGTKTGEGYWSRTLERAARAFESYVIARMHEDGYHNDFLVNVRKSVETGKNPARYPYLLPGEIKPVADAFGALFDTIQTRADEAGNVAMFSRAQDTPRGLSLDEAEAIVGAVREANPTAPPMIVLESVDQAPSVLLRDIAEAGASNDVEAAYHEGKVYVFAPHLRSMERAMFVIAHHELRHHGMRSLEGKRLSTTLAGMVMSNPNLRDAARAKMDAGLAKDMIQGAEEALADMDVAEVQALKGWPKVLAAVRQWLRGMATRLRAKWHTTLADAIDPKDWTDADVAAFVSRSEAVSKGGRAKFGTDGTVFQRVWHGTPHRGIDKFSTDAIGTGEGAQAYGWGLYFAGKKEVADYYRKALAYKAFEVMPEAKKRGIDLSAGAAGAVVRQTNANPTATNEQIARRVQYESASARSIDLATLAGFIGEYRKAGGGQLYEVDIPEDGEMLLWDRPLSEQPAKVRKALDGLRTATTFDEVMRGKSVAELLEWVDTFDRNNSFAEWIESDAPNTTADELRQILRENYSDSDLGAYLASDKFEPSRTGESIYRELTSKLAGGPAVNAMTRDQLNDWYEREVGYRPDEDNGSPLPLQELRDLVAGFNNEIVQTGDAPRTASLYLAALGIRGIKYLDGTSRPGTVDDKRAMDLLAKHKNDVDAALDDFMRSVFNTPARKEAMRTEMRKTMERLKDAAYNYVIFSGDDAQITSAMFSRAADESGIIRVVPIPMGKGTMYAVTRNVYGQGSQHLGYFDTEQDANEAADQERTSARRAAGKGARWWVENPAEPIQSAGGSRLDSLGRSQALKSTLDARASSVKNRAEGLPLKQLPERAGFCYKLAAEASAAGLGDMVIGKADNDGSPEWHAVVMREGAVYDPTFGRWFEPGVYESLGFDVHTSLTPEAVRDFIARSGGMAPDSKNLKLDDAESGGTMFSRAAPDKAARNAEKTAKAERAALSSALTAAGNSVRGVRLHAGYVAGDFLGKNLGRLHWWYRSVGTPYNLAQREPQFKPVFDAIQTFLHDVSHYATEAADLAPTILPKLDRARDILKGPMKAEDAKAVAAPVFEGTLGWLRTADGDPIKVEEAEAQAASMSADEKAQELLRSKLLNPKVLRMWQGLPIEQYEQAIETRYASQVLRPGVVWSDAELRSMFKLTEPQIGFYKEFRAATDKSLDDLTVSAMLRVAGDDVSDIRAQVLEQNDMNAAAETIRDRLFELAGEQPDRADELNAAGNNIIDMADRVQDLKDRGYAPLSRFGGLTLDVVTPDGERQYFGMFETKRERNRKLREMRENFPDARITMGTTSEQEFKQFAGVTPETLELFGDVLGMTDEQGKDQLFQEYIRKAKSNRSGLKRLIHRKGVPGFSEDIGRVLASFVYSNARQTSSNLHAGTAEKAIEDISQENGNLKDYAIELNGYVRNPQEEAQALRSMMFAQFLGGSIASAMVNMTQPFNVTFPYLSQYGGPAKAAAQMAKALPDVGRKMFPKDPGLTRALRLAEEAGIVSPQEVFHLQAQAGGKAQLQTGDGTMIGNAGARVNNSLSRLSLIWGRPFAFAEQFNRRLTFIAAYRTAVEQGIGEPAEFASQAVEATQFVYNKGNRPPWARGAAGALLFTFKTYSISMMELMTRAVKTPEGRRAALLMLGMVVLMAGIDGLPFMEDMEDVIDGFAQRVLDKNWSTKIERNRLIAQGMMSVFGESSGAHVAEFLARGLSGMPGAPIDVSGRLGLHNLIPGTGIFLKKDGYGRDVADIAGPAGSFAGRVFEAGGQLLSGQPVKAAITASPLAVANIKKAADMATTGFYPDTRGNMVVRTTLGDAVSKGIGFQPNTVAKVQELTFQQQRIVSLARMVETEIVATIATARVKKDEDAEAAAWKRLDGWNKKNPDSPISITNAQLVNAERRMTTEKSVRMLKSAPRDLRPGLANALKPLEPAEAGR